MTVTVDEILCLNCTYCTELVVLGGYVCADCSAIDYCTRLRGACDRYKSKSHDCKKYSPINRGWCTGDCERCESRTEWKEWAE